MNEYHSVGSSYRASGTSERNFSCVGMNRSGSGDKFKTGVKRVGRAVACLFRHVWDVGGAHGVANVRHLVVADADSAVVANAVKQAHGGAKVGGGVHELHEFSRIGGGLETHTPEGRTRRGGLETHTPRKLTKQIAAIAAVGATLLLMNAPLAEAQPYAVNGTNTGVHTVSGYWGNNTNVVKLYGTRWTSFSTINSTSFPIPNQNSSGGYLVSSSGYSLGDTSAYVSVSNYNNTGKTYHFRYIRNYWCSYNCPHPDNVPKGESKDDYVSPGSCGSYYDLGTGNISTACNGPDDVAGLSYNAKDLAEQWIDNVIRDSVVLNSSYVNQFLFDKLDYIAYYYVQTGWTYSSWEAAHCSNPPCSAIAPPTAPTSLNGWTIEGSCTSTDCYYHYSTCINNAPVYGTTGYYAKFNSGNSQSGHYPSGSYSAAKPPIPSAIDIQNSPVRVRESSITGITTLGLSTYTDALFNFRLNNIHSWRFDAAPSFSSTNITYGGTYGSGLPTTWPTLASGDTIGFWTGTGSLTTVNVPDGGVLLLGNKTAGQSSIKLASSSGNLYIRPYILTDRDHAGFATCNAFYCVPDRHGIWVSKDLNVTHNSAGTFSIVNTHSSDCSTTPSYPAYNNNCLGAVTTQDDNGYILIDTVTANYRGASGGTFLVQANGPVKVKGEIVSSPAAQYTERFLSTCNAVELPDLSFTKQDGLFEALASGTCCGSFVSVGDFNTVSFSGVAYANIKSDNSYVLIKGITSFKGATGTSNTLLNVVGKSGVVVTNAANISENASSNMGWVNFISSSGMVYFGNNLTFTQTSAANTHGLLVKASGSCNNTACPPPSLSGGAYVNIAKTVNTTNKGSATTTIRSDNSYVMVGDSVVHSGVDGKLEITAPNSKVEIGKALLITRTGEANDSITGKFIEVKGSTHYNQTAGAQGKGLFIQADGNPCPTTGYCGFTSSNSGGWIHLNDTVFTKNLLNGTVIIRSVNDRVVMGGGFKHEGVDGKLLVSGKQGVIINKDVKEPASPTSLYITRGTAALGSDTIIASDGNIYIENKLNYQHVGTSSAYNFVLLAGGTPCINYCGGSAMGGGIYIGDSATVNQGNGFTLFKSKLDSVGMQKGYTYVGAKGSMAVNGFRSVHIRNEKVTIDRNINPSYSSPHISDSIKADSGEILIEKVLRYTQTGATTPISGAGFNDYLFAVVASGKACSNYCNGAYKGGYVTVGDTVRITHAADGYTVIKSVRDSVSLQNGLDYVGMNGDLLVQGETAVHVFGVGSKDPADNGSVVIVRNNKDIGANSVGFDSIISPAGNIYIEKELNYTQTVTGGASGAYMFVVSAEGGFCSIWCKPNTNNLTTGDNTHKGGYLVVGDSVNIVHAGNGFTVLRSTQDSVGLQRGYNYTGVDGYASINGFGSVHVSGEPVTINRNGVGNDSIISDSGHIKIEKWLHYTQTVSDAAPGSGLTVQSHHSICGLLCDGKLIHGYVWLGDSATITNVQAGYTDIISDHHFVLVEEGFYYRGADGNLYVKGETRVDMLGVHPSAPHGDESVVIIRDSALGNDKFYAPSGHIYVENGFTYDQTGADNIGSGAVGSLILLTEGQCNAKEACLDTIVDGYVWLKGNVRIANVDVGTTKILSQNHYVQTNDTFLYSGQGGYLSSQYQSTIAPADTTNTTLLVYGHTGIDMLGAMDSIRMDSVGQATFMSYVGHVHFKGKLFFEQSTPWDVMMSNYNGLTIVAKGDDNKTTSADFDCHRRPLFGYVWFEDTVKTATLGKGRVEIVSEHQNVIMDEALIHTGKAGNLDVIAKGETGVVSTVDNDKKVDCALANVILTHVMPQQTSATTASPYNYYFTQNTLWNNASALPYNSTSSIDVNANPGTDNLPWYLTAVTKTQTEPVDFAHQGRGYVHVGGMVTVDLDSIGNAVFRSKNDIVQFDTAFQFNNNGGSTGDLYVDGYWGVRSIGPVITKTTYQTNDSAGNAISANDFKYAGTSMNSYNSDFNVFYVDSLDELNSGNQIVQGSSPYLYANNAPYDGSGNVRYHSSHGFVDFLNTFNHEAPEDSSRLDIQGFTRVKFADTVTIAQTLLHDTTYGEAFIYSNGGFVDVQSLFKYYSKDADLRIWARGNNTNIYTPSKIDSSKCVNYGGFVHFKGDSTIIDYTAQSDLSPEGRTWIKSFYDDVVIDTGNFYYSSANGQYNGMFWLQAGQDILARTARWDQTSPDSIRFTQPGEEAIVWEAQGLIRTQQALKFDRTDAKAGNLVLKAGYDYTTNTYTNDVIYNIWVDKQEKITNAEATAYSAGTTGTLSWKKSPIGKKAGPVQDYPHRLSADDPGALTPNRATTDGGGDIWFQGSVDFDLENTKPMTHPDSSISVLLRAVNSVFIDSNFTYTMGQQDLIKTHVWDQDAGYLRVFAENGNIEAISNQDANTAVNITITELINSSEIRFQAGNNPNTPSKCEPNTTNFFGTADGGKTNWDGNILFNKPLNVTSAGLGATYLYAERDIENQVDAPFTFINTNDSTQHPLVFDAGRHIETHKKVTISYLPVVNALYGHPGENQIWLNAGRLTDDETTCDPNLCKTIELGTSLTSVDDLTGTSDIELPYEPRLGLPYGSINDNKFATGGAGHGSILLFDSLEINYSGRGGIMLQAENGNIESDPYLHRRGRRTSSGNPGYSAKSGAQVHDAQLTINHDGRGVTALKAIDIRLHDKIAYYAMSSAQGYNGQFYMLAYDSILTRNLQYVNLYDTGSVFITTDKYKSTVCSTEQPSKEIGCGETSIHQGHIVLGYGADGLNENFTDSVIFNFNRYGTNTSTSGGNVRIMAGYRGYKDNPITGYRPATTLASIASNPKDAGKGYGGNITYDYTQFWMPKGDGDKGGSTTISTPNGNIWGKDSVLYRGFDGNLLVDAGLGSVDDYYAILWSQGGPFFSPAVCDNVEILNTAVSSCCEDTMIWRTGNIIMKGGYLNFGSLTTAGDVGKGNAVFRTREGFIDVYDAFTVDSMSGALVKLAQMESLTSGRENNYGDISERDFQYTATQKSGSVFFGADDNIMLNYGNANGHYLKYGTSSGKLSTPPYYGQGGAGQYNVTVDDGLNNNLFSPADALGKGVLNTTGALASGSNPYYYTPYEGYIDGLRYATYNVNKDGYLWYHHVDWEKPGLHKMYRGCEGDDCSPLAGVCKTTSNGARDLVFDFDRGGTVESGGLGIVANNFIDMFTKFVYYGGSGANVKGMSTVPGTTTLHGESVAGYGLYIKSQYAGAGLNTPEDRRGTCEGCNETSPDNGKYEMTYVAFHDDARIHVQKQKALLEAPVIEFFGHSELDTYNGQGANTLLTAKADSLIFHDSVIIDGTLFKMTPYTTDAAQRTKMSYGVVNDRGGDNYADYHTSEGNYDESIYRVNNAITMIDRMLPVIELGYQRCNVPSLGVQAAPNFPDSINVPKVGGDIIVTFKDGYVMPIMNTVVANHARISFLTDSFDHVKGGTYSETYIRTDLLRIRNKVEFYTEAASPIVRTGEFKMASIKQMETNTYSGMYTRHLHTEPGSELSLPGENSLIVGRGTTIGGYGTIHENVFVTIEGIVAPGFASLMEGDCQTPYIQGKLRVHNLKMEENSEMRISISKRHNAPYYTQTDTIEIKDSVYMQEQVPLDVFVETESIDTGCYLFMQYRDLDGPTSEYVKHLYLTRTRYQNLYFSLDYSTPGEVRLCVTKSIDPGIQRAVTIPYKEGIIVEDVKISGVIQQRVPKQGEYVYYVPGHQNISFVISYTGDPRSVSATSGEKLDATGNYRVLYPLSGTEFTEEVLDGTGTNGGKLYRYTLRQVTESWTISFGEPGTLNEEVANKSARVWAYRNNLYVNVPASDVVSIYNMTGVLQHKLDVPQGMNKMTLERGIYAITLKDGTVYKIVIN